MKSIFAILLVASGVAGLSAKPDVSQHTAAECPCVATCAATNCANCTNPICKPTAVCQGDACKVVPAKDHSLKAGQPARNAWRFVFHGSRWWYYTEDCSWKVHDGTRWNDYSPPGYKCHGNICVPVDNPARAPVGTLSTPTTASVSGCSTYSGARRVGLFGRRR